jgi:hypothetical protein
MKIVHVVYINDYFPELWKYTFPSIEYYARKIGAELNVITERKFPDWHIHYEKAQVWEAGKNADANILFDSDILIHPEFPDFTDIVPEHHVGFNDNYFASDKFLPNDYFIRDGRNVGIASNVVVSYKSTHDFWKPLNITPEQGNKITIVRPGDIDEYLLSHNLAKYGLKYTGITWEDWQRQYLIHTGTGDRDLAIQMAKKAYTEWGIT